MLESLVEMISIRRRIPIALALETTNLLLTRIGFPTEQPFGAAW